MMQFSANNILRGFDPDWSTSGDLGTAGLHATMLFTLKEHLKSVGWVIQASSDGTSFNTTPGNANDVITTVDKMNQDFAWFVIKKPDDNRQLCFQIQRRLGDTANPQSTGFRIKYSVNVGFTSGTPSAIQTPYALDEQFVLGKYGSDPARFGTDASPQWSEWLGSQRITGTIFHIAADNAAPYGWWIVGYGMQGDGHLSGRTGWAAVFDPIMHAVPGDLDPYAFYFTWAGYGNALDDELQYAFQPGQSSIWGYIDYGGPVETWLPMQTHFPDYVASERRMQNPINNKVDRWPVVYGLPMGWSYNSYNNKITAPQFQVGTDGFGLSAPGMIRGYKGVSSLMQFCNAHLSNGQALKAVTSRDKIVVGKVILDWNGSLPLT